MRLLKPAWVAHDGERFFAALAIRTADRMNKSVAIRTADCATITRWRLFSRFVTPVVTCATTE